MNKEEDGFNQCLCKVSPIRCVREDDCEETWVEEAVCAIICEIIGEFCEG